MQFGRKQADRTPGRLVGSGASSGKPRYGSNHRPHIAAKELRHPKVLTERALNRLYARVIANREKRSGKQSSLVTLWIASGQALRNDGKQRKLIPLHPSLVERGRG